INLSTIRENIGSIVKGGAAKKKGSGYDLDLDKVGVTKLLGGGSIGDLSINILAQSASQKAIEKVEAAGGTVTIKEQ
ncbi:MAG: uL15m family ribosomal protein, partial [Thermoplasmatota archaeon]